MNWPQLNWLPVPLWALWRDLTWAAAARKEWCAKVQRYYDKGADMRQMAIARARSVIAQKDVSDWDDNVPPEWGRTMLKRWGVDL